MRRRGALGQASTLTDIGEHPPRLTLEEVVGRHVQPQPDGCWLYNGQTDNYGQTSAYGGQPILIHRFVYETLVGPIDTGLELHHLCQNPGCCNPAHLEPLTRSEHRQIHVNPSNEPPR